MVPLVLLWVEFFAQLFLKGGISVKSVGHGANWAKNSFGWWLPELLNFWVILCQWMNDQMSCIIKTEYHMWICLIILYLYGSQDAIVGLFVIDLKTVLNLSHCNFYTNIILQQIAYCKSILIRYVKAKISLYRLFCRSCSISSKFYPVIQI